MPISKLIRVYGCAAILISGFLFLSVPASFSVTQNKFHLIQLNDDTINPVTAEYIVESINRAEQENVRGLIIQLDTPGGLLNSTRMIVKKMLTARVPIIVYIAPNGSRAGSAGVFITYASHIAAMAPSTNIGAAHPIQLGFKAPGRPGDWDELKKLIEELKEGKNPERDASQKKDADPADGKSQEEPLIFEADHDPMSSKLLQDTVAFVKAIANERNRNVDWAIQSVVKSESITAEEALEKGVVELIAQNDADLLSQLDGRTVSLNGEEIVLYTKDAYIETVAMDASQKFFNVLANPNIAYFLMILGFYGLLFEVTHPGFGVPGVLGIVFLILAFYSMQTLPTNYAGLALFILGLILLIAEVYTPTFGILTLGGMTCLVLGSMLLFESVDPIMRVSKSLIYTFSASTAAITLILLYSVVRSQRMKVKGGQEGLIGQTAEVQSTIAPGQKGKVFVHGELWNAVSEDTLHKGDTAVIIAIEGLTLNVEKES